MELKHIIEVLKDKKKMKGNFLVITPHDTIGLMAIEKDKTILEQLQSWVNGYIELTHSDYIKDYDIIVNEDGIMQRLEYNKIANLLFGLTLYGNVVIVRKGVLK